MVSQSYVCTENEAILSLQQLVWSFKSFIRTRASLQFWSAYKKNSYRVPFYSVVTVLIFQISHCFGTEASILRFQCTVCGTSVLVPQFWYLILVPRFCISVLVPRFWYLGSGSYFSIPGFRYNVFRRVICIFLNLVLAWFHFGVKSKA